ncbi:S-adenosylmethionine:tRNA ribosyltransferase-isomerase [Neolewinella lacunae]|uniref:S-adenosylmethionine:tRNA ribosyltransferase-isomerase n=1 Tax=Neolewinella lacunae TaxID=1517758 RepID=A0A923PPH9_9BACT|nr:S-adenosylmethionine:tRNA ribosyltransferase-isomerase [Neolewinella lacunae]MBC6996185.1 S-adenosylmethionine:tRNA ribosyltransferase-isomerase [Neolewinella lacunae]MDN3635359.1 S-adenosylmethionine:tRNA ribosyltransferase-isomerase [Neolewinella lacunae]
MKTARDIAIADYDYDLPDTRIARHPVPERDAARQLYYRAGSISEGVFRDLPSQLLAGTLLIGNRTRVIHARLFFPLEEGKRPIEIFCLDPLVPVDHAMALGARTQVQWKCLIGGNRRWKHGSLRLGLVVNGSPVTLVAERLERLDNTFAVAFHWETADAELTFGEVLAAAGSLPLPPYLGRESEAEDEERYQTVFARVEGSVAAPTAGLHFTPAVLESLAAGGVEWQELTLHVGAGTFKPVASPTLGGHEMHREYFGVTASFVDRLAEQLGSGLPVVSVGTTSLRCLESLYCLGAQLLLADAYALDATVAIGQWAAEDPALAEVPATAALQRLAEALRRANRPLLSGYTEILLSPASGVRVADGLITNFHQPHSTLLLLVAALVGDDWRRIYAYALEHGFRFLSYGDSSLLWQNRP